MILELSSSVWQSAPSCSLSRTCALPLGVIAPPAGANTPNGYAQKSTVSARLTHNFTLFSPAFRCFCFTSPPSIQTRVYQKLWFFISSQRCFKGRDTSTLLIERGSTAQPVKRDRVRVMIEKMAHALCLLTYKREAKHPLSLQGSLYLAVSELTRRFSMARTSLNRGKRWKKSR